MFLGQVQTLPLALVAMVVVASGRCSPRSSARPSLYGLSRTRSGAEPGSIQTPGTLTYAAGLFAVPVLMTTVGAQPILTVGGIAIILAAVVTFVLVGPSFRRDTATEGAAAILGRVARLPLFAGVSPAALEVAVTRLTPVAVHAGEVIVREGEPRIASTSSNRASSPSISSTPARGSRAGFGSWAPTRCSASWG